MRPGDERGFIHKKLLGFGSKILGLGAGIAAGPVGIAATGILGAITSGPPPPRPQLPRGSRVQIPKPGIAGRVQRFLPGGATGFTTLPPGLIPRGPGGILGAFPGVPGGVTGFAEPTQETGVCPPRGFHLNKSSYFLRDGTFVERGTRFVKNRRLNEANGKANNRSIRRLERAQGQAKKVLRATGFRTISKQSSREMRTSKKAACK